MKKTTPRSIIERDPTYEEQLTKPEVLIPPANRFFTAYKQLHRSTGVPEDIPMSGSFLHVYSEAFRRFNLPRGPVSFVMETNFEYSPPRHNPHTGQEVVAVGQDVLKASQKRYKRMLFDHLGGYIAPAVKLTPEAWDEHTQPPDDLYQTVRTLWQWAALMEDLREKGMLKCLHFMSVKNGEAHVDDDFEEKLRDALTVYMTPDQEEYQEAVTSILKKLDAVERKFGVKGLTLLATDVKDDGYLFNILELKKLGKRTAP